MLNNTLGNFILSVEFRNLLSAQQAADYLDLKLSVFQGWQNDGQLKTLGIAATADNYYDAAQIANLQAAQLCSQNLSRLGMVGLLFDLSMVVYRVLEQVQVTTAYHQLKLAKISWQNIQIVGDSRRLEQVIRNLVENAVKYTPSGGLIQVSLLHDTAAREVQVLVKDNGIGVSPGHQDRLFEKFYRASNAATIATGLGLGLSISAEIIRKHAGRIWVESSGENMGSTFGFALPISDIAVAGNTIIK